MQLEKLQIQNYITMKTKLNYIFLIVVLVNTNICFGQVKSSGNKPMLSAEQMRQEAIKLSYGLDGAKIDELGARSLFEAAIAKGDVLSLMWKGVGMYLGMYAYPYHKQKGLEAMYAGKELTQARAWANDPEALYLLSFADATNDNNSTDATDTKIRKYMETASSQGFVPAQISMALKKFAEGKHEQGVEDLKNLNSKGIKKSLALLGSMYLNSQTSYYNQKEALLWIRKGADSGDPAAMLKLAQIYYEGKNTTRSVVEAKKWAKLAYDKGYGEGLKLLAQINIETKNIEQTQAAVSMYGKAAEAGNGDAAWELGLLYWEGKNGIAKSKQKAFSYFRKAAELGNANAMAGVGMIYSEGQLVKKNTTLSRYWTNLAEENGANVSNEKPVQESLFATIMKNADFSPRYYQITTYGGDEYIVKENADMFDGIISGFFTGWLNSRQNQQEVINGLEEVSNTKIAKTYAATITTSVNLPEPFVVGNRVKIVSKGYVVLGMMAGGANPNGLGGGAFSGYSLVPSLPHGAVIGRIGNNPWFLIGTGGEMTVKQNGKLQIAINDIDYTNNKGYFDVSVITYKSASSSVASTGIDVKIMQTEIAVWYKKAAEKGNPDAQLLLAKMYLAGEGIPQSDKDAFMWFKETAKQGNVEALYNVASMYSQGRGTPRNIEQAILNYEELEKKSKQYNLAEELTKLRSEYLTANLSKVNVRIGKLKGDVFDIEKKYGSVNTKAEITKIGGAEVELSGSTGSGKKIAFFLQDDKRANGYFIYNSKLNLAGRWELKGKPKWITNANGETEVLFEGQFVSFFDNRGELKNTPYPCKMTATITKKGFKGTYVINPDTRYEFTGIMEMNFSDK